MAPHWPTCFLIIVYGGADAFGPMLTSYEPASRGAIIGAAWNDLRQNAAAHALEVAQSESLGYASVGELPLHTPAVEPFDVPKEATAMGPACPFAFAADAEDGSRLPLIFETTEPLFSAEECQLVIDEANAHIAAGTAASGFTFADTCRNVDVSGLPGTLAFLNQQGLARVAALSGACFGETAIGDPQRLRLYRALVVHYDEAQGLTHQQVHRDHSLVTCVVTLNDRSEYTGGGTWMEDLGQALAPPRGHALLQASALRHAGHVIETGQRWVMVLFLIGEEMRYGEHKRHFAARAQKHMAAGENAAALHCITLARAMCDDTDKEIQYYALNYAHGNADAPATMSEQAVNP